MFKIREISKEKECTSGLSALINEINSFTNSFFKYSKYDENVST